MPFLNTNKRPAGSFRQIPFWKLRARFRECGLFDEEVATAAGMSKPTLYRRMSGAAPWTSTEIAAVCRVVRIPPEQVGLFFFPDLPDTNENTPAD